MTKGRKRIIGALAAAMAALITVALLLFSPVRTAFAERSATAWTTIGEIYNDSTKGFNEDNLKKLYKALTGTDTFASVQTAAGSGETSADFRTINDGSNNVSVWFGGKKWDAVYLTTAQNGGGDTQQGDVILDLWQSADNTTTRAQFNDWCDPNSYTQLYPTNMYSKSKIRVDTLNAVGSYTTNGTTLAMHSQDKSNQYARFTMSEDEVPNSLTKYIATPAQVGYQENEFDAATAKALCGKDGKAYYLPNDAYGTPKSGGQWYDSDYNYSNKMNYDLWKNDYLWLPSVTEAGFGKNGLGDGTTSNGMWNTDDSLRSTVEVNDSHADAMGHFIWFRSGFHTYEQIVQQTSNSYYYVYVMGTTGEHCDYTNDTQDYNIVRPALHLNLTAANKKAESAWKNIGEIYNDGSSSFNRDNMQALYTALTGSGSYGDVRTALSGGNKTSADFRGFNDGQNVQVTFGGIKWDAVYLTKAKNGDFILDLWQSADNVTETSKWANHAVDEANANYPSSMYSTSYIRVQTLNAGGYMSTSGSALAAKTEQDPNNKYARFTMSGADKSLVQYIVQPQNVAYQETENNNGNSSLANSLVNDAYGTDTSKYQGTVKFYNDDFKNYTTKDHYGDWQNDYLWLPSLAETGNSDTANQNGLWKTDVSLRSTVEKGGKSYAWLRSGSVTGANGASYLDLSGERSVGYVNSEYLVRPAIHLNLTAINNSLKKVVKVPENVSKTYTGGNLTSGITDTTEYTVSEAGGTDVGNYDITLTLKKPDDYKWKDNDPNKESITLRFEITTAKNTWKNDGVTVDGGGWTYGDTGNLSAPSQFGAPTYTYTHEDNVNGQYYADAPTAAGHYYVKATVDALESKTDPSQKNYNELVSAPVRFEIKKAEAVVNWSGYEGLAYNGGEREVSATAAGVIIGGRAEEVALSITYGVKSGSSLNNNGKPQNAGEYTASASTSNGNYTLTNSSLDFTIDKATINLPVLYEATYSGAKQEAAQLNSLDGENGEVLKLSANDYKVEYEGDVTGEVTPIKADTYTVTVTLISEKAANYKLSPVTGECKYTIKKAANSWKAATPNIVGWTYGDTDNDPTGTEATFGGNAEITYSVRGKDNYSGEKPVNAGEYTMKAAVAGTDDYGYLEQLVDFRIEQATLTITSATVAQKPYDGTNIATIKQFIFDGYKKDNDKTAVDVADYTAEFKSANAGTSVKVTITSIMLGGAAAGNYTVDLTSQVSAAITGDIEARELAIELAAADKFYDGNNIATVTVKSVSGKISDDDVQADGIEAYFADVNAGERKTVNVELVTLSGSAAGNYKAAYSDTLYAAIKALQVDVTFTPESKTYVGKALTPEVTSDKTAVVSNIPESLKSEVINSGFEFTSDKADAGTYALGSDITVAIKNSNFTLGNIGGSFTIDKAAANVTIETPAAAKYNGSRQEATVAISVEGGAPALVSGADYTVSYQGDVKTNAAPVNADSYEVTVALTATADKNYELKGTLSKTFTIDKAIIKLPALGSATYNGGVQYAGELNASFETGVNDETLEITKDYTVSYQGNVAANKTPQNADTYAVTVALTASAKADNYALESDTAEFVIEKATAAAAWYADYGSEDEIEIKQSSEIVYDGREHVVTLILSVGGYRTAAAVGNADSYKDAGSYVFTATDDSGNFTIDFWELSIAVGKATAKVVWTNLEGGVYGSDIDMPEAFAEGVGSDAIELKVEIDGASPTKGGFSNAGKYIFCATIVGDLAKNYALDNAESGDVVITQAPIVISWSGEEAGYKYTFGSAIYPSASIESGKVAGDDLSVSVEIDDNSPTKGGFLNAGAYVFAVSLTGGAKDNYIISSGETQSYEIEKAKITGEITWTTLDDYTYSGLPYSIPAATARGVGSAALDLIVTVGGGKAFINAGSYIFTADLSEADKSNYEFSGVVLTKAVEIKQKVIDAEWEIIGLTYTGDAFGLPRATAEGLNGDNFALVVAPDFAGEFKDAGVYVFRAELDGADAKAANYALAENTASHSYTVAKQQVAAPEITDKVYNGKPQTADIAASLLYTAENDGGINVDNYPVRLTLTDGKNYKWADSDSEYIELTFRITKAEYILDVTFDDFTITYDAQAHSILIDGVLPDGVDVAYDGNGQKAVGEYTVTAIFTGDERNYEDIPSKTATLTILPVSHDLSGIKFEDVTVKYDGGAHSILIVGTLPTNVTVDYEVNGQTEPNIYTVIAIFCDPDGEFERMTATLTILRTQTQTAPKEESGSGGSSSSGGEGESGGGESGGSGESGADVPEVIIDSEEGFDPTLELVVEKVEDTSRSYLAWGADEVSEKYSVKLCNQDGEEVPIEGKVTVRLLIPEAFRDKDFDLMALAKSDAASVRYAPKSGNRVALVALKDAASITYTRDGDYVVFEADGLSEYVFTSSYTPYFPVLIIATCVLLVDVAAMIILVVVIRKKRNTKAR